MKTLQITVSELILVIFLTNLLMKMVHANGPQLLTAFLQNLF